jgi:hypothetical protein
MGSVPAADAPLKVLFLGDQGHHKPAERFAQLEPVLATRGIDLVYTENLADLDPGGARRPTTPWPSMPTSNRSPRSRRRRSRSMSVVARGSCRCTARASASRTRRPGSIWWGRSFRSTARASSRPRSRGPRAPGDEGIRRLSSWDETYVHTKHNERGRTVLEERVEGNPTTSPGPGSAPKAMAACSTPPGATTSGRGAIPGSITSSSGASASRPAATRRRPGRMSHPEMTKPPQG